jgi:hypothetical protein
MVRDAGLVPFEDGFVAVWGDDVEAPRGSVQVTRIASSAVVSSTWVDGTSALDVSAGVTHDGLIAIAWDAWVSVKNSELRMTATRDATTFDPVRVVHSGAPSNGSIALVGSDTGLGMTWVNRPITGRPSVLFFAPISGDGVAGSPIEIEALERAVIDTSIAFGNGPLGPRFGIATHRSGPEPLDSSLYITVLEANGSIVHQGARLTMDATPESPHIAFAGPTFAAVSSPWTPETNEQHIELRQVDGEGNQLFPPLWVSESCGSVPKCPVNPRHSLIVAVGPGRYAVVWSQQELGGPFGSAGAVYGAIVDCTGS